MIIDPEEFLHQVAVQTCKDVWKSLTSCSPKEAKARMDAYEKCYALENQRWEACELDVKLSKEDGSTNDN